jgi:tripartite-type tricarboxylate transporter receptor subunit TctC
VAPAGTSEDIIIKLNGEVTKVLESAETKERFAVLGMEAVGGSAEHFAEFLRAESQKGDKGCASAGAMTRGRTRCSTFWTAL